MDGYPGREVEIIVHGWLEHKLTVNAETVLQFIQKVMTTLKLTGEITSVMYKDISLLNHQQDILVDRLGTEALPRVQIFHLTPIPLLLPTKIASDVPPRLDFEKLLTSLNYKSSTSISSITKNKVWVFEHQTDLLQQQQGFIINPKAKIFLDKIQKPFAVISIAGAARSGKSTFLTYLMRCLTKNSNYGAFECSDLTTSCTVGIWMWPELITWIDPKTKEERKILLLDLEGLDGADEFSTERTADHPDYFLQLFAFGCMISSLMIFNSKSVMISFDQTNWDEIRKLTESLQKFSKGGGNDYERNWVFNRPHLLYLARRHGKRLNLAEDKKFWKHALANQNYAFFTRMKDFFDVAFVTSFLSLTDIQTTSDKWPKDASQPDDSPASHQELLENFLKKLELWVTEKLGEILQDFSVTNITTVNGNEIKNQRLVTDYFPVVEAFWKVVLSNSLQKVVTVVACAIEGNLVASLERDVAKLREEIRIEPTPCVWKSFKESIQQKKIQILENIQRRCQQEQVDWNLFGKSAVDDRINPWMRIKKIENIQAAQMVDYYFKIIQTKYEKLTSQQEYQKLCTLAGHVPEAFAWKSLLISKLQSLHSTKEDLFNGLKQDIISETLPSVFKVNALKSEKDWLFFIETSPAVNKELLDELELGLEELEGKIKNAPVKLKEAICTSPTASPIPNWLWLESPDVFQHWFMATYLKTIKKRRGHIENEKYKEAAIKLFEGQELNSLLPDAGFPTAIDDFSSEGFIKYLIKNVSLTSMSWVEAKPKLEKMAKIEVSPHPSIQQFKARVIKTLTVLMSKDCHIRIHIQRTLGESTQIREQRVEQFFHLHQERIKSKLAARELETQAGIRPTKAVKTSRGKVSEANAGVGTPPELVKPGGGTEPPAPPLSDEEPPELPPKPEIDNLDVEPNVGSVGVIGGDYLIGLRYVANSKRDVDSWICFLNSHELVEDIFSFPLPPDETPWEFKRSEQWFLVVRPSDENQGRDLDLTLCQCYVNGVITSAPKRLPKHNALVVSLGDTASHDEKPGNFERIIGQTYLGYSFHPLISRTLSRAEYQALDGEVFQATLVGNATHFETKMYPEALGCFGPVSPAEPADLPSIIPMTQSLQRQPQEFFNKFPENWKEVLLGPTNQVNDYFQTCTLLFGGYTEWDARHFKSLFDAHTNVEAQRALRVLVGTHTKYILLLNFYPKPTEAGSPVSNVLLPKIKLDSKVVSLKLMSYPKLGSSTLVEVLPFNALDVVQQTTLANSKARILLLNASSVFPGGTWGKGGAGSEEEIFRRTDLFKTLSSDYRINEWEAVLSPGVLVFRASGADGYRLYQQPVGCDIISVCPYMTKDHPAFFQDIEKPCIASEYVIRIMKKLFSVLQYASQTEYTHIILDDFGCENFGTPATDLALIWNELLKQYGGLLPHVIFAIEQKECFTTFNKIIGQTLGKSTFPRLEPTKPVYCHPGLETLDWCPYGGSCQLKEQEHRQKRSLFHPPNCVDSACRDPSRIHQLCVSHPRDCPGGLDCIHWDEAYHQEIYLHKPKCTALDCSEESQKHMASYWHHPTGRQILCKDGDYCRDWTALHFQKYKHSFPQPCLQLLCTDPTPGHFEKFSHLCRAGEHCSNQSQDHRSTTYHVLNHACPTKGCPVLDEDHLNSFSHPGIDDIRRPCPDNANCSLRLVLDHVHQYSHDRPFLEFAVVNPLISGSSDLSPIICSRIPYSENVLRLKQQLDVYMKDGKNGDPEYFKPNPEVLERITSRLFNTLPIHRMKPEVFCSVLNSGALMASHQLHNLDPTSVVRLLLGKPEIREHIKEKRGLSELVKVLVEHTFLKYKFVPRKISDPDEQPKPKDLPPTQKQLKQEAERMKQVETDFQQQTEIFRAAYPSDTDWIIAWATKVTEASIRLSLSIADGEKYGIDFWVDKVIGIDRTIFAIYGPNTASYGDFHLIFKNTIKWHPDFYVTPHAATNFYNKSGSAPGKAKTSRPWGEDFGPEQWREGKGQLNFHHSKFHPIAPHTWDALALDLIGRVAHHKKCDWGSVTTQDVKDWWSQEDSHRVLEAHLPYQVPLSYIDRVVVDKQTWSKIPLDQQTLATEMFPIHVEDSPEKAADAAWKLCHKKDPDCYEGFCFVIKPERLYQETLVPLKLLYDDKTTTAVIAFEATGEFILCLSDSEKVKDRTAAISLIVTPNDCSIVDLSPLAANSLLSRDSNGIRVAGFNTGLSSPIRYQVVIDSKSRVVTLSHYGSSELYCISPPISRESSHPNLTALCFFTFTVAADALPVQLYNVRTLSSPIPSVITPKPSIEDQRRDWFAGVGKIPEYPAHDEAVDAYAHQAGVRSVAPVLTGVKPEEKLRWEQVWNNPPADSDSD